ncbi:YihY/virulence factor BrkB family protein [Paeniglutamicibacter gangotriensis]|uniref:YihY/virulence factor BrkB family protein n=1 Tax=Paeniglutamicibacter gangotriensis TaxID=254787 RepID=UPI0037C61C19
MTFGERENIHGATDSRGVGMSSRNESSRKNGTAAGTAAKARHAPAPDDERKADWPTHLDGSSWKYIFKRSIKEFSREKCTDLAAALTYFAMLSLFPALLALVSLLGVVGQAQSTTQTMVQVVEGIASPEVADTLRQPIEQLASAPSAGFALVAGLLGALWSASGYVGAFGRAVNQIYDVREGRPFYKLKPLMLLLTLVLLLIAVVMAILMVVSGPLARTLGDVVGLGETAVLVWNIAKWPVLLIFAIALIAALYYGTPNVKQPKFRWLSPGSVIALVVLAIATLGFFFYVSNFGNYNKTYGAIGGVIVMLLWIWIANLSLLFGAVFDSEAERGRELEAGIEAEESLQLPPRDTKASDKLQKQEDKDVRDGRELRLEAEATDPDHGDETKNAK